MIDNIQAKDDGTYVINYGGLPYHATPEDTPEVFELVRAAIAEGAPVNVFVPPTPTLEQTRNAWKDARAEQIAAITVTVNGHQYDGDEASQDRMARTILGLQTQPAGATVRWVLADNSVAEVDRVELGEALALAIAQQNELWATV